MTNPELGSKILVIEDDVDALERMTEALTLEGYTVVTATDARSGIHLLAGMSPLPAAIVLDLDLPVMPGWDFLRLVGLYRRLAEVPVVVLSRSTTDLAPLGCAAFLPKPADPRALVEALKTTVFARGTKPPV